MSESMHALACVGCGHRFYYMDYHVPHCKNPRNSPVIVRLQQQLSSKTRSKEGKGVPASSVAS